MSKTITDGMKKYLIKIPRFFIPNVKKFLEKIGVIGRVDFDAVGVYSWHSAKPDNTGTALIEFWLFPDRLLGVYRFLADCRIRYKLKALNLPKKKPLGNLVSPLAPYTRPKRKRNLRRPK